MCMTEQHLAETWVNKRIEIAEEVVSQGHLHMKRKA